jgi:hypothetical protein
MTGIGDSRKPHHQGTKTQSNQMLEDRRLKAISFWFLPADLSPILGALGSWWRGLFWEESE